MKAILLAGGLGTRLRPLTQRIPKCLVPIRGVPLLQIWINSLNKAGLGPFLINTHYLNEKVEDFIRLENIQDVTLVNEINLLGTAGTLINNINFFEKKDGLLLHADNYCLADFKDFLIAHKERPKNCLLTMMTFRTENPSLCGIVEIDEHNVVKAFHEKKETAPGDLANGAIYVLSPELLEIIREDYKDAVDFSNEIIPNFLGRILSYEVSETFIDIGTPEAYEKANLIEVS